MENIQKADKQELAKNYETNFLPAFGVYKAMNDLREIRTIEKAVMQKTPSIATIRKEFGEQNVQKYIMSWILFLDEFLDLKERGNEFRLSETANFIIFDYYNLNIADINLIFRRAMSGHYGKFYDRLSGATILSWFKDYFEERCNICEMMSLQEHQKLKQSRFIEQPLPITANKKYQ